MPEEKTGIQNIMEIITAADSLVCSCITEFGDGFDWDDFSAFTDNIGKIKDAVSDVTKVVEEGKDIDEQEIRQLIVAATDMVFNIIAAVKALRELKKKEEEVK